MKKKLKKFFYIILRFYIPDCIKGHSFFLKKIKDYDLIVDLGSNKGEFEKIFLSQKKNVYFSSIEFDENHNKEKINKNNFAVNKILSDHDGVESINFINLVLKIFVNIKNLCISAIITIIFERKPSD